jgi:hypothetical protein
MGNEMASTPLMSIALLFIYNLNKYLIYNIYYYIYIIIITLAVFYL